MTRLIPNIVGPKTNKRKTTIRVTHSIMTYDPEAWKHALELDK